ncbi:hypothetical protein J2858_001356 [Neorhizobium galegae]|uniref:hypothetical protein n=1 Tax=Rhizobium/Agrobacterium group TaxID=227290 RepID=UPI001AEAB36A|nr:hypothetical protein [Neorhizobium galegae]MBP2548463.1 hypothetical protein [Neorhizobium galegae]
MNREQSHQPLSAREAQADHWSMMRFLAINACVGFLIGLGVAFSLVWFDLGGLGTRVARSHTPFMVMFMLSVPMAFTFSGAVTASAVMLMPYKAKTQA